MAPVGVADRAVAMSRDEDKIISLQERRARDLERKQQAARQAQAADRRRKLAEHGPAATRIGRIAGRVIAGLILMVFVASVVLWLWSRFKG